MNRIEIIRPDDWHLHVRDGDVPDSVVPDTARVFARAIIMPNLQPPVTTVQQAAEYRDRIRAATPRGTGFEPLMTLYLTDRTDPALIREAADSGFIHACKLYPAGATTNSDAGVTDLANIHPALETMAEVGLPLLVHGEVTRPEVDFFDREKVFIDQVLTPVVARFPGLKVVFEHITTRQAVAFVDDSGPNVAATITAHHLLENRNALFRGGLRPHHFCLPVLKREEDREALVAAATSGSPRYFLGTDSAPHPRDAKESDCGCAGIYTAHAALAFYAEVFEAAGALDRLEGFASLHGADFYGLPRNSERISLERKGTRIPATLPIGSERLVPFRANGETAWTVRAIGAGDQKGMGS